MPCLSNNHNYYGYKVLCNYYTSCIKNYVSSSSILRFAEQIPKLSRPHECKQSANDFKLSRYHECKQSDNDSKV